GGGCDGKRACIAAHNGERGAGKRLRLAVSINEGKLRCARQGGNRAFHRKKGCLQYVDPVDLLDGCDPDPYLGAGLKCGKELLPAWGVEFLGIIEPFGNADGIKNDSGCNHRPCQRPAPRLIDTAYQARWRAMLCLECEIGRLSSLQHGRECAPSLMRK